MVKVDPEPKKDSLLLEWIVKGEDGKTVAYKMPGKAMTIMDKDEALKQVEAAIENLRKGFVKDIHQLLLIKFKLLEDDGH